MNAFNADGSCSATKVVPVFATVPIKDEEVALSLAPVPTPNADLLFHWSPPRVKLAEPQNGKERRMNAKQRVQAIRKRTHDMDITSMTISHLGLVQSRINPPSFFSMHLRRSQILQNVKKSPGLVEALAGVVDRYLEARTPPDLPDVGPDLQQLLMTYHKKDEMKVMASDEDIGRIYTFPEEMAARIASTLYTNSPVWIRALDWAREEVHGMAHAAAGGYLSIAGAYHCIGDHTVPLDCDPRLFEKLSSIRRRNPSPGPIMLWSFVPAGDPFGMDGDEFFEEDGMILQIIEQMAEGNIEFKWASCGPFVAPHASCNSTKHLNTFLELTQTGHSMTGDAESTRAILEAAARSSQGANTRPAGSLACNAPLQAIRRAGYILQNWFSELVAIDATYGVLSTGNAQIIGARRRGDRTLHTSGIIGVPRDDEPSRVKLHSGMILAALEDLDERIKDLQDQKSRGEAPRYSDEFFDIDSTYLPESLPRTLHPKEAIPEIPSHLRCHMHQLAAFLNRQHEVTLRWPARLFLLNGLDQPYTVPRGDIIPALVNDKGPVIFKQADIMIRTKFDENTFLANLWNPDERFHMGHYFVAKIAHGDADTAKLREEANCYLFLHRTNHIGIPRCFGYFESPAPNGVPDFGVLLLEVCDRSLAAQKSIGRGMKTAIKGWLEDLHQSGIVHTRISQKTILFDGDNRGLHFRIVGWGNAHFIVDEDGNEFSCAEARRLQDLKDLDEAFRSMRRVLKKEAKQAEKFEQGLRAKRLKRSSN